MYSLCIITVYHNMLYNIMLHYILPQYVILRSGWERRSPSPPGRRLR